MRLGRVPPAIRCCNPPKCGAACARRPAARMLHQSALDALAQAGDSEPVVVVDLVKLRDKERRRMEIGEYSAWSAFSEARTLTGGRRLVSLTPHAGGGILLGHRPEHAYDLIELTEYPSGPAACSSLTDPQCASRREQASCPDTSLVVWTHRSAAFASMPTFAQTGGEADPTDSSDPVADPATACPFAGEQSASAAAWTALQTEPTKHMYAFNMIRIPDMEAYKAYSLHFASLPQKYGMKFVDVLSCKSEAESSVLLGVPPSRQPAGSFDLIALVYFPTSQCFAKSWSDHQITDAAYPLRQKMLEGGFEHVWIRCSRFKGRISPEEPDPGGELGARVFNF